MQKNFSKNIDVRSRNEQRILMNQLKVKKEKRLSPQLRSYIPKVR